MHERQCFGVLIYRPILPVAAFDFLKETKSVNLGFIIAVRHERRDIQHLACSILDTGRIFDAHQGLSIRYTRPWIEAYSSATDQVESPVPLDYVGGVFSAAATLRNAEGQRLLEYLVGGITLCWSCPVAMATHISVIVRCAEESRAFESSAAGGGAERVVH
jgi:hypothetical protein